MTLHERETLKSMIGACIVINEEGGYGIPHPQLTDVWKSHIDQLVRMVEILPYCRVEERYEI